MTVTLTPGTEVEVRNRFDGRWTRGFEIATVHDGRFTLRRRSDSSVLPAPFEASELRAR